MKTRILGLALLLSAFAVTALATIGEPKAERGSASLSVHASGGCAQDKGKADKDTSDKDKSNDKFQKGDSTGGGGGGTKGEGGAHHPEPKGPPIH